MIYKNRLFRLFRKYLDNLYYTRKIKHKDFLRKIRRYSNKNYIKNKSNLKKKVHLRNKFNINPVHHRNEEYRNRNEENITFYPMFAILFIIALFITGYTLKYINLNILVNKVASKEIDYDAFREMNLNEQTISDIMKEIGKVKETSDSNKETNTGDSSKDSNTNNLNPEKDTSDSNQETNTSNSNNDSDIVINIEDEDSNNERGQVIEYVNNQIVIDKNDSDLKKESNTTDDSVTTQEELTKEDVTKEDADANNKQIINGDETSNKINLLIKPYQEVTKNINERNTIANLTLSMMLKNYNVIDKKRISNSDLAYLFQMLKNKDNFKELYSYYTVILTDLELFPIDDSVDGENVYTFSDTWDAPRTFGGERKHEGADIFPEENKAGYYPIVSVSDGVVEKMGWLNQGGYRVGIRSSSGAYFYYAHLDSYAPDLEIGDEITAGQFLGYMGNSGYGKEGTKGEFEVHLHFGIYLDTKNGELSVNPYRVLRYLQNKRD